MNESMNESTVSVAIVNERGETVKRIDGEEAKILQDEYFHALKSHQTFLNEHVQPTAESADER